MYIALRVRMTRYEVWGCERWWTFSLTGQVVEWPMNHCPTSLQNVSISWSHSRIWTDTQTRMTQEKNLCNYCVKLFTVQWRYNWYNVNTEVEETRRLPCSLWPLFSWSSLFQPPSWPWNMSLPTLQMLSPIKRIRGRHLKNLFVGTLPKTNSSPLKMDGWNTSFLLGWPTFRGELLVSGSVLVL